MKIKIFENEFIPEEIHVFYDDLANIYLKSNYEKGREKEGPIKKKIIGRYNLNVEIISLIDQSVDISYLLNCEEGYIKQDELVLYYDKYIHLKELENIILKYANEIFDIQNMKYIEKNKNVEIQNFKLSVKPTIEGIFLASHIFGSKKVKALFENNTIYCKDNIPLTEYIDKSNYDISFLIGNIKEKIVLPQVSEQEKKKTPEINTGEEFIGQNDKGLKKQLEELIKEKEVLKTLIDKLKNNKESKENKEKNNEIEEIKKVLKELTKQDNSEKDKKAYLIENNKKNQEKLEKKFKDEYKNKDYAKYLEDTANVKLDEKDKKAFNEVLKSSDKKENNIISQKNFNKFRELNKKNLKIIDFLFTNCAYSKDPLQTLENSLCFLSCKYEGDNFISFGKIIKDKLKKKAVEIIGDKLGIDLEYDDTNYLSKMALSDVDDIRFYINKKSFNECFDTKEYKLYKLMKDTNNIKRSYSLDKNSKRIFKRARRLLDNLFIELIVAMTKSKDKNFDDVKDDRKNILRNSLIYLDEYLEGLEKEDFKFIKNCPKEFNITNMMLHVLKSNEDYRDSLIRHISYLMLGQKYESYTNTKDKNKVINIFPTKSSLEYNMRLRDSINIYYFYENIYEKNKENNDKLVCNGAKVYCNLANDSSVLLVKNSDKYIQNKAVANVEDTNIIPFKFCSVNKVCAPKLNKWEEKNDISINGKKALMESSKTFCKIGGMITITDANQNEEEFKKKQEKLIYDIEDYVNIEKIYPHINEYVTKYMMVEYIEKELINIFRKVLKAKIDEKNLESNDVIPAVDNEISSIVNVYPLAKIINAYARARLYLKNSDSKWDKIGESLVKYKNFDEFIKNAKSQLEILYSPYNVNTRKIRKAYWMPRLEAEYLQRLRGESLKKKVALYHKIGGGINAGIKTPWCASFANYILQTGLRSASSQCFYSKEGQKYFEKINEARYGAVIVFKNNNNSGHCSFIISEEKNGYICLGGNQSNIIKKSFFPKNEKIQGFYWPK